MPRLKNLLHPFALVACALLSAGAFAKPPKHRVHDDSAPDLVTYGQREDVMRFGAELAAQHKLDPAWVQARLAEARFVPSVAQLIMPPPAGTAKNWAAYRARFVEPRRIRAGLAFWRDNEAWLKRAEAQYGVPPELIVGVVGVESLYGQQMGGYRVIDALATLAFDFPSGRKDRSAFFRDELAQFFVLCQRAGLDPLSPKGSYAGAMGMGQFMPSAWNKYAVDFDGDGHIDLHHSAADVIGSVAHYFTQFGWQRGLPTRFEVAAPVDAADRAALLVPDIVPSFTAQQFAEKGAGLPAAAREFNGKLALIELQNGPAAPSYVAGTTNFYAVTRYNWSSYYAMAVLELGETVALVHQRLGPAPGPTPASTRLSSFPRWGKVGMGRARGNATAAGPHPTLPQRGREHAQTALCSRPPATPPQAGLRSPRARVSSPSWSRSSPDRPTPTLPLRAARTHRLRSFENALKPWIAPIV